ncbi:hypothetical protein [Sorangium sp. So ce1024]|uniref:hypothetical protein n=1 Tax=Sorangium sp. So ce1024 TaxID=3133327 RepID=UPI003F11470D
MPLRPTEGSTEPRRRLAAPRARSAPAVAALARSAPAVAALARSAPAVAALAALLGIAAPAAAQAPAAPPTAAPGDPAAPPAPAGAPAAPSGATPAPSPSTPPLSPSPPEASPAPPGSAPMSAAPGYYLVPVSLPPWANPRTIEYEEGDPIPRGYALKTRADRTLVTAGLVTFGISYAASFAVAGTATIAEEEFDEFGPLFIPFVGPMIAATTLDDVEGAGLFLLTMNAVTQVGGLLLVAAGLAHEDVYLERQFPVRPHGAEKDAASRWPTLSIGASSAELRWRF